MNVKLIDGHPHDDELAAYVDNTLEPARVDALEAHLLDCSACAKRLQEAASLQMLLHDAAAELELEAVVTPLRPVASLRRRLGAVGGLWAAAAAVVLMVCQQGGVRLDTPAPSEAAAVVASTPELAATGSDCEGDPSCAEGLLASIDPLQSVDPLESSAAWRSESFAGSAWSEGLVDFGEPCGSGEDGGPLVCDVELASYSG